jgi:hypothetical protein
MKTTLALRPIINTQLTVAIIFSVTIINLILYQLCGEIKEPHRTNGASETDITPC